MTIFRARTRGPIEAVRVCLVRPGLFGLSGGSKSSASLKVYVFQKRRKSPSSFLARTRGPIYPLPAADVSRRLTKEIER